MFKSTLLYSGVFTIFISFFSLLNILFCYYFDNFLNIQAYSITFLLSLIMGTSFIFFNKRRFNEKINFFEKLLLVTFGFFYFPFLISIPYYLSIYDISLIDSYFEAISGFTCTGFTIIENTKKIDEPLLIWRSTSQCIGGLYFLYSLFLLTGSQKIKIKNIYSNYESVNLSEIKNQFTKVLLIYFLITIFVFILITFSGIRLFEGLNLSMTLISSGGFIPTNFLGEIIRTDNQKIIISFTMLFSFFNLYLIYYVFFRDDSLINIEEDLYLLILLLFVLVFVYIFYNNLHGFNNIIFAILSSFSNIGLGFEEQYYNLPFLFLIIVIIGGSSFSTSSGIKFIKLYSLFKFSLKEIYLSVKPLYISSNTLFLSKHKIKDEEINNYFIVIIFFIVSLFILSSILSFDQLNFQNSLTLSILTLTNTVNSSIYNLSEVNFINMNVFTKFSLIFFMTIGKIELLSLLILIKKFITK